MAVTVRNRTDSHSVAPVALGKHDDGERQTAVSGEMRMRRWIALTAVFR